ncbi:FtsX-like permease family protein [Actinoplanes palleronii]|uniref:ABC3 transporter permease C-terminal domain-containing protein n=1 Tax=Actinoplanes palleronii TaxID=113570 RepID=A0ABQ4BR75_9ACTN|nr:FtsX-like permease family protein [Actinoplanes palleronii]GIE73173.1 hypothetical protein Apa02nite_092810 [Actinoplanes palleronii]
MLRLAAQTVRARWAGFAGVFVALTLGVCLLTVTGLATAATLRGDRVPVWFSGAALVAVAPDTVSARVGSGDEAYTASNTADVRPALPAAAVARLAALPGAVVDRQVPAMAGEVATDVHPWASAALHPAALLSGRAPIEAGDAVVTVASGRAVGDLLPVRTAQGTWTATVTGVVTGPDAVYVSDAEAARLSGGRVDAIAFRDGTAAQAVPERGWEKLTGSRRSLAEPDVDGEALTVVVSLLGTFTGIAVLVSIFVVAGTFAFAVSQRRRELALLRSAGATPRQVRRLVLGEAMIAAGLAAVAGCALGLLVAPWCGRWMAAHGLAPEDFTVAFNPWALLIAAGAGFLVALLGTWVAARRAGRIRPVEALREAALDRRVMTPSRWIFGLLFGGGAIAMVAAGGAAGGEDAIALTFFAAYFALIATVLFTPLLAPLLIRMATGLLPGVTVQIARGNALTSLRRTTSTVAPMLVTVGLAVSLLASSATAQQADQLASRSRVTASALVGAVDPVGLPATVVSALAQVPGVTAAVPVRSSSAFVLTADTIELIPARYAGPGIEKVWDLPPTVSALRGTDTVAVGAELARSRHWSAGDEIQLWLADTTPVTLRVVTVLPPSLDLGQAVLLPYALSAATTTPTGPTTTTAPPGPTTASSPAPTTTTAPSGPAAAAAALPDASAWVGVGADAVYLAGDGDPAALAAAAGSAGRVATADAYFADQAAEANRMNDIAMLALLGLTLLYTTIAIANTLVMSTADRARDIAVLRLGGATPRQVLGLIATETGIVVGVAVLLAAAVSAGLLLSLRARLTELIPHAGIAAPWPVIIGVTALCALVAFAASLIPAALLLRTPPATLASIRD